MYSVQCDHAISPLFTKLSLSHSTCGSRCNVNVLSMLELGSIASQADYYIVDGDNLGLMRTMAGAKGRVISCGMNCHTAVTASSIDPDSQRFIYCLQHGLTTLDGTQVNPQELPVQWDAGHYDVTQVLLGITTFLVCGIPLPKQIHFLY